MHTKKLQIEQLEVKIATIAQVSKTTLPATGWIKAVRTALGMSLRQLAARLSVTIQSMQEMERREQEGSITLKSLREVAQALDMRLVYGFVPNDGSLDALIERKAHELAMKIITRTSQTMQLEGQENSPARIQKAIAERTASLKQDMPKALWD